MLPAPSRCTSVLAVALTSCVLRPCVGALALLKLRPALIVENPVKPLAKVFPEKIAWTTPPTWKVSTGFPLTLAGNTPVFDKAPAETGPTTVHPAVGE